MKYTLTSENQKKIFHVLLWSGASAILASLLNILPSVDFPPEYAFLPMMINTAGYALKEYLADNAPAEE